MNVVHKLTQFWDLLSECADIALAPFCTLGMCKFLFIVNKQTLYLVLNEKYILKSE